MIFLPIFLFIKYFKLFISWKRLFGISGIGHTDELRPFTNETGLHLVTDSTAFFNGVRQIIKVFKITALEKMH